MSFYRTHIFFCANERTEGKKSCGKPRSKVEAMKQYAKEKIAALQLDGPGGVRVSISGCLGRCSLGPTIVIYPEGVWYTYSSNQDIDAIIEEYIVDGKPVTRLLL